LRQYNSVQIKVLHRVFSASDVSLGEEIPAVGDMATIIEVYESPRMAYELESVAPDGTTRWMATFEPGDADFDIISRYT